MSLLLLFVTSSGGIPAPSVSAAYTALIASAAPDFVVLAEMQPMEPLQAWTAAGGLPNTFYTTFRSHVQTSIVAGGIYRRLDVVRQDAMTLAVMGSAAAVDASLGSYYLDTAADRLYVSTTTGVTPDTFALVGAWFTLFFSNTSVSFSDRPLYNPLLIGTLPTITSEMPDTLFGAVISAAGSLSFINDSAPSGMAGVFDILSRLWVWRNKLVTFKLGGTSMAYADYQTIDTMRINGLDVDDELVTLQLEDVGNILNQSLPKRTWGDGTVSSIGPIQAAQDISGQSQPVILGSVEACPLALGSRVVGVSDSWYGFDFNSGPYGSCSFDTVYWVERATKIGGAMTPGVDYVVSGGVVTVINPTYFFETHDIIANITQISTIVSPRFGTMVKAILELCGESVSNIDTAAVATADAAAPQTLARYIGAPIQAADLIRELEQSVNGQVYKGADGRWTCRVLSADVPADPIALSDADCVTWSPQGDLRSVLNEVRVRWGHRPLEDSWREVSASSDFVRYSSETSDSHRVDTWLMTEADATALAHHLLFLRTSPSTTIGVEERSLSLMRSNVGDLVAMTRDRAPNVRTGRYDSHYLRVVKIQKDLGPDVPKVTVWLNDLDGQTDRIFRLAASGSILTWATATNAERAMYGFLSNSDRYINPTDPNRRRDQKVLV